MQAKHHQQAEEIARLHASQISASQSSFTAASQGQGRDRQGAAGQAATAQQPYSHRVQERPDGGGNAKIASIIRYGPRNGHIFLSLHVCFTDVVNSSPTPKRKKVTKWVLKSLMTASLKNAEDTGGSLSWPIPF